MKAATILPQALSRMNLFVASIGTSPDDSDDIRLQKLVLISIVLYGAIPIMLFLGFFYNFFHERITGWMLLICAIILISLLIVVYSEPRFYSLCKFFILVIGLSASHLVTITLGGIVNSGFAVLWAITVPMVAIIVYSPTQALYWFIAFLVALTSSVLLQPYLRQTNNLPSSVILYLGLMNAVGFATMNFIMLYSAFRMLRREQDRSENLLLNILPKEIAAILKLEQRVIADHYDSASILFADIVNFTPMSAQMQPVELVDMLNEVFSYFDTLVDKYGLEKIKTIGDCYMAAAGVPRPSPQHASTLARLALDIQAHVTTHTIQGRKLAFRIGINSGPVTAGVIGRRKFIYDLWGDAVNTASRMESHGSSGAIQITEATYDLVKDAFV